MQKKESLLKLLGLAQNQGDLKQLLKSSYNKKFKFISGVGEQFAQRFVDFLFERYASSFQLNNVSFDFLDPMQLLSDELATISDEALLQLPKRALQTAVNIALDNISLLFSEWMKEKGVESRGNKIKDSKKIMDILHYLIELYLTIKRINHFYNREVHPLPIPIFLLTQSLNLNKLSQIMERLYREHRYDHIARERFESVLVAFNSEAYLYSTAKILSYTGSDRELAILDVFMLYTGVGILNDTRIGFFIQNTLATTLFTNNSNGSTRINLYKFVYAVLELIDRISQLHKLTETTQNEANQVEINRRVHELISKYSASDSHRYISIIRYNGQDFVTSPSLIKAESAILATLIQKKGYTDTAMETASIREKLSNKKLVVDETLVKNLDMLLKRDVSLLYGSAGTGKTTYILLLLQLLNDVYKDGIYFDASPVIELNRLGELLGEQLIYCSSYKKNIEESHNVSLSSTDLNKSLFPIKKKLVANIKQVDLLIEAIEESKKKEESDALFSYSKKLVRNFSKTISLFDLAEKNFSELADVSVEFTSFSSLYNYCISKENDFVQNNVHYIEHFDEKEMFSVAKYFLVDRYTALKKDAPLALHLKNYKTILRDYSADQAIYPPYLYQLNEALAKLLESYNNLAALNRYVQETIELVNSKTTLNIVLSAFTGKAISNMQQRIASYNTIKPSSVAASTLHKLLYSNYSASSSSNNTLSFVCIDLLVAKKRGNSFIKFRIGSKRTVVFFDDETSGESNEQKRREKALSKLHERCSLQYLLRPEQTINPYFIDDESRITREIYSNSLVVLDECSMIDVHLMHSALTLFKSKDKIDVRYLLLGDDRQLPSIKAGNFFADLIKSPLLHQQASGLKYNFRSSSQIIEGIHNIFESKSVSYDGIALALNSNHSGLYMLTSQDLNDFERITTILGEIVDHDLSKYNNENIHIVTPYSSKRFICSSGEINTKLQLTIHSDLLVKSIATQGEKDGENRGGQEQRERLRTYIDSIKEYYLRCIHNNFTLDRELAVVDDSTDALNQLTIDNFLLSDYSINRVEAQSKETDNTVVSFFAEPNKYKAFFRNDKVVYTNNNYEFMLFNGFIGKIENVIKMKARDDSNRLLYNICNELIVVDFYGQKHFFSKRETVNNLQIAYATTIHKVQGSEYEKVIFLLPASRRSNFMSSNLIYTGMTRASKALYFITSYDKPIEFIRSLGGTKRNTLIPYIAEKYNEQEIVEQI